MIRKRARGIVWAAVSLLAARGALGAGEGGFVEEMPAGAGGPTVPSGEWSEAKGTAWHGQRPYVAGLGFEVTTAGWPRLVQRGFLDVFHPHNGTRELYKMASHFDLGLVRTPGEFAKATETLDAWVCKAYRVGGGERGLTTYVSRLTPAVLVVTRSDVLELFAGAKYGGAGRGDEAAGGATDVPAYVAFPAGGAGEVLVRRTDQEVDLGGGPQGRSAQRTLQEPWALLWFGPRGRIVRTAVPNILSRSAFKDLLDHGLLTPADLPVLVVFQKRPLSLKPTKDGLAFTFGPGGAGAVSILPLLGFYHPPAKAVEAWATALPDEVAQRCRAWARRLKHYPIGCTESCKVAVDQRSLRDGSAVTIRDAFTYMDLPDDWGTKGEKLAPVPPVAALAAQYGFGVTVSGRLAPLPIATHSGPYTGVAGADAVEITVRGLDRYVRESLAADVPEGKEAEALIAELRAEVRKMVAAGPLAPTYSRRPGKLEAHFKNPAETILALGEAIAYLDEAGRRDAVAYVAKEIDRANPMRIRSANSLYDARDRSYNVDAPQAAGLGTGESFIRDEERANSAYAFWQFAQAGGPTAPSGQWADGPFENLVRPLWPDIKSTAAIARPARDWATCGYFRGAREARGGAAAARGEDRGSVWAANGRLARWIALARLAERFGDANAARRAWYGLARTALLRFAQGKCIRYAYDEKFQTVDLDPDWMIRFSTGSGNGAGPGLLWTDHWAGPDDDVRAVIRWDEFGPVIDQAMGTFWQPIQPHFQDLTPECGRFLSDHLAAETRRFVRTAEENCPAWFLVHRPANIGKEIYYDDPRNSYGVFLGKCYALGADGQEMLRCQDIPFVRVGDLYHVRRLVANLRCLSGLKWRRAQ